MSNLIYFRQRTCWAKDEPKDLFHKHRQDYNSFVKVKISPVGPAFARNFFIQTISSKLGGLCTRPPFMKEVRSANDLKLKGN